MNYFRLFFKNTGMKLSSYWSYRTSTLIDIIVSILNILLDLSVVIFVYMISNGLPGWSLYELILFNGMATIATGIALTFFMGMVTDIGFEIKEGSFDKLLIKPLKIVPQMIIHSFRTDTFIFIVIGALMFIIALINLNIELSFAMLITYAYTVLLSSLVFFGVFAAITGIAFKVVKVYQLMNIFWSVRSLGDYPINIYTKTAISFILTFVVPVTIANYYPASFVLGKISDLSILGPLTLLCFGFGLLGYLALKIGIKHYSSAGG